MQFCSTAELILLLQYYDRFRGRFMLCSPLFNENEKLTQNLLRDKELLKRNDDGTYEVTYKGQTYCRQCLAQKPPKQEWIDPWDSIGKKK